LHLNECLLSLFISLSTQSGNFWTYPRVIYPNSVLFIVCKITGRFISCCQCILQRCFSSREEAAVLNIRIASMLVQLMK